VAQTAKGASHGPDLPGRPHPSRPDRGCQGLHAGAGSDRKSDYQRSEQRIGIVKEAWYFAHTPAGDQLVAYMESPDFPKALSMFSQSQDEFDRWFKQRLADATGLDLNTPRRSRIPRAHCPATQPMADTDEGRRLAVPETTQKQQ
jgi:hypothetical protein